MICKKKRYTLTHKRSRFVIKCFSYALLIIIIYCFILQIYYYDYFYTKSINNFTRYRKINSTRGEIVDRNGFTLASNQYFFELWWNKKPFKYNEEDNEIINFIENILTISIDKNLLQKKNNDNAICFSKNVDFNHLGIILEKYPTSKRIMIKESQRRIYLFNNFACHTIGYLNYINEGITGIEKICNENLEGTPGCEKIIINSTGTILQSEIIDESVAGKPIKLTLDFEMQSILEKVIGTNNFGCGLIFDPENGSLRALVSSPRFDPNIFLDKIDNDVWKNFSENKNLLNRCFQATYPPGSIFKIITAVALLEENIISKHNQWFCNGQIEYKNRDYHCNLKQGHGNVTIKKAICHSCNIPFYSVAMNHSISIDTLYKYAHILGLGEKTQCIFYELPGIIPSTIWKKNKYGEKWYTGETLSVTIGQGPTQTTPIQIARLLGAIMTGYLVKPRILEDEKIEKNYIPIKKETLNIIQESISQGVQEGTSKTLKKLHQWEIYSKTGTSQVCALPTEEEKNKAIDSKKKHHGIIACYVKHKYKNIKPFVLVIVLENIGTARITAQHAKQFIAEYEKIL
jgi:penicillin-binding protein 2